MRVVERIGLWWRGLSGQTRAIFALLGSLFLFVVGFIVWLVAGRKGEPPSVGGYDAQKLGDAENKAAKQSAEIDRRKESAIQEAQTIEQKARHQAQRQEKEAQGEIERIYKNGTNKERVDHLLRDDDLLN